MDKMDNSICEIGGVSEDEAFRESDVGGVYAACSK